LKRLRCITAVLAMVLLCIGCQQSTPVSESMPQSSKAPVVSSVSSEPPVELVTETVTGTVHLGEDGQFTLETGEETLTFLMDAIDPDLVREGAQAEVTFTVPLTSLSALPLLLTAENYTETEEPPMWAEYMPKAEELLRSMTIEEKVGQMFFLRCPETPELARDMIREYQPGGFVLFGRDFEGKSTQQVQDTIASYQETAKLPMLISADEEGGRVVRASANPQLRESRFPFQGELYRTGGIDALVEDAREKSRFLLDLGVNVNLAPVCDCSTDPADYIYTRTIGEDHATTAKAVAAIVETMCEEKMGCSLKHFPGYGSNVDTHTGIAHDERPYEQFVAEDFLPFVSCIEAGAGSVMVSHNIVTCMDAKYPASISPEVHRVLREELGFEGVILTDDLAMQGISKYTDSTSAAVQAVLAGNDMLLVSDYGQVSAVLEAVQNGTLTEEQIDAAVRRILCWKLSLNIIKEE